jgi:hypothetical protein
MPMSRRDFLAGFAAVGPVTDLLYTCLCPAALVHSSFGGTRSERRDSGIYLIPLGLATAVTPFLLLALVEMEVPQFALPDREYLPLLGIVIPGTMAWAIVRSARSGRSQISPDEQLAGGS